MNKKTLIVSSLIILTGIIIAGTYAFFSWNTTPEETTDVRVVVNGLSITYEKGDDIVDAKLNPTMTKEEGIVKEVTMTLANSGNTSVCADFNLILTTLPTELQHESFKYELYKNDTLIGEGNFSDKQEGQTIKIGTSQTVTDVLDTYTLYLWIDGNMDNPLEMGGKTFTFTLNANATDGAECDPSEIVLETSGANAPELFDGMIPIKWDENNVVVKADVTNPTDNAWYNYGSKQWANAVMVTSSTRSTYMSASVGSTINTSDILAYFVWIPRYRYELFNVGFTSGTSPRTINIVFESTSTTESTGSTNGTYLTHPAFTFGNTKLSGFWVAKFEPSGASSAGNLKVLPGVSSLRSMAINAQYNASKLFANTAYLTQNGVNTIDAHMMKNTEWGAVTYLSHSIYGKNAEVSINSNSSYITGGGTGTAYTTNIAQSTTGNVYGVYDMNGCGWENVMGNYNKLTGSSGLTVTSIDSKYVDIYTGTTVKSSILGDATGEVAGWYSDHNYFVDSGYPWFGRGFDYSGGTGAGLFVFYRGSGETFVYNSFRPILSAK